jgi:hypothetical protein
MGVQLTGFRLAGGGGREVHINPAHVVCVLDVGERRAQIVTTGLSNEASMSLIVEATQAAVIQALKGIK